MLKNHRWYDICTSIGFVSLLGQRSRPRQQLAHTDTHWTHIHTHAAYCGSAKQSLRGVGGGGATSVLSVLSGCLIAGRH